jgi:predicted ATPase/DNA-binding SARP family transcriptional activator
MEFRILGSLDVRDDTGCPVALPGAKPRALLAMLLLHANEPVSAERLAIALWGEDAPAGAAKTIQVHVSRLRRVLGERDVLVTTPAGYLLRVRPGELDADRFKQLVAEGHQALADGAPEHAGHALRDALSLWRGPALADVGFEAFAQAEIARLEDERLAALEARIEADLALGRHAELAGELAQLVAAHPLRERLHGQLMLSLYRSGRQADALQAYRDARDALVERLGIEPGPELRERERAILAHDPALDQARPAARADQRATAARIPAPPTPTIGREADLARLRADLLGESTRRLVTLVGPGGVGKTRLALELARSVAEAFRDGAYFVSLAPVGSFEDVAATIVRQLDVVLLASESAEQGLARHLGDRDLLLVLDNFEHVLDAAALVADLLATTTRLRILVTSREPLRLRAERLCRLDPLALPGQNADTEVVRVGAAPAVELFLAVARARDPSFELGDENSGAIERVCRRLDGLPLAIELAGARIGLLTVPELADRLSESLDALGTGPRDAPARQRTLRATLEWSHALLSPDERAALAGLSVFAGGCTVEAMQAVTGASLDVLDALVAKNLVVRRTLPCGAGRLTLLDTVADFARDRLTKRHDGAVLAERHFGHYLALAERAAPEIERSDAPALMAELDREIHNLRAALTWALDRDAPLRALELATAMTEYWDLRDPHEGARWLRDALALPRHEAPLILQAAALASYARCLDAARAFDEVEAAARESFELARSSGDAAQCAVSLTTLAAALMYVGRADEGYPHATEAERLTREARDEPKHTSALELKALTAPTLDEALALGEQAAAAYRRAGAYRRLALLQTSLTYNALVHGDIAAAQRLTPEALRLADAIGDSFVRCLSQGNLGLVMLLTGDHARAAQAFTQELRLADENRYEGHRYEAIDGLAGVAAARGDDELAATLLAAAEATGPERHSGELARQLEQRYFAPARIRLGDQAWRAANAAGAAMTPREATDTALSAQRIASPTSG